MLTDLQMKALMLEMHKAIEESASKITDDLEQNENDLCYPPNHGFTDAEKEAIRAIKLDQALKALLEKSLRMLRHIHCSTCSN